MMIDILSLAYHFESNIDKPAKSLSGRRMFDRTRLPYPNWKLNVIGLPTRDAEPSLITVHVIELQRDYHVDKRS